MPSRPGRDSTRFAIATVVGLGLALVACDESESDRASEADSTSGDQPASTGLDPKRQPPAAPIEGARTGGTVTVPLFEEFPPAELDPSRAYNTITVTILTGLVTRSLTQYVYDAETESMVLVPDIATDLGTPNDDFTEWTYTIRDGVRFEDGTEVTADDVAYGIMRSFDRKHFPEEASPTYSTQYFLDGDTYKGPYESGTDYDGAVVDGDTITLKMERPFPDMPYWGAFPAMGPIPQDNSDPDTYGRHPLATGPYKFAEFAVGKSLTLVKNDEWDAATDAGRHQYPDRYVFQFSVPERTTATILGDTPAGETMVSPYNISATDYAGAQALRRVSVGSASCTHTWHPDYREITDIRIRRAIGYAYPYQVRADVNDSIPDVTTLSGASIFPPGFPGRQEYSALEDTEPGRTDPEAARALLQEAGVEGEYVLSWPYLTSNRFAVAEMRVVADAMEAAGFKPEPLGRPTFESVWRASIDPQAPLNVRIGFGWCQDWPSGSAWIPAHFGSGGVANHGYFSEPAVDDEIERIGRLPLDEQPAAWATLDKAIMTDYYPAIVTYYDGAALLHGSRIGGMNIDNSAGMPTWKDIYVTE